MTIYYIDPVEGDDANAGTSEGAGNAWKTIEKAISLPPVHGDVIYCKNNGTYTPSGSSWVMPLNSGGYLYGVSWIGYETTPGDDGRCTVDCLGTKNAFTTNLSTQQYHILRNWDIWNSSGTAVGAATNGSGWQIMNVKSLSSPKRFVKMGTC